MNSKRIFVVEDHLELHLMERVFKQHVRPSEYELVTVLDLSDERVYRRELPEGYDIYWVHISAVEDEALRIVKEKQPWSKLVIRSNQVHTDGAGIHLYFVNNLKADRVISKNNGTNERFILETLKDMGVELIIKGDKND